MSKRYIIRQKNGEIRGTVTTTEKVLPFLNWPQDEIVEVYEDQFSFQNRVKALSKSDPKPDVTGFLVGVYTSIGKQRAREIMRQYPEIVPALDRDNWQIARMGFDDALADGFITQDEYDTILDLWSQYHLPMP